MTLPLFDLPDAVKPLPDEIVRDATGPRRSPGSRQSTTHPLEGSMIQPQHATARPMRFPQGVVREPRDLEARWLRDRMGEERCAVLHLPGAFIAVVPRRATENGKRIWLVVVSEPYRHCKPACFLAISRRGVRDTLREALRRMGWDVVLFPGKPA